MENKKTHLLVVDDDDRIRNLLKDYLKNNNFIVSSAREAEDAKKNMGTAFVRHAKQCDHYTWYQVSVQEGWLADSGGLET